MSVKKAERSYLGALGRREGLAVARALYDENKKEFDSGRQLTAAEYQFLLKWTTDRLRKNTELPVKRLETDRFEAFEHEFWEAIHNSGLI